MKAGIITIGDEILIGQVVDTNAAWLGQILSETGIEIRKICTVSDRHEDIVLVLAQILNETDIVFITGGLGPTRDDITKKAIADFLGVEMFFHEETFEKITKMFERRGIPMSTSHHDQCLMPHGVKILNNSMGTAPGMLFYHKDKTIISMPGVPYEMKAIMTEEVIPWLSALSGNTIIHKTILTSCAGETIIEDKISDIVADFPEYLKIAYLPALAQVRLRLSASGDQTESIQKTVDHYTAALSERLSDIIYGYDDSSLEKEIYSICKEKGLKIGTAESCTGGSVASRIVSVAGSSAYYIGSVVSYSNEVKRNILKVKSSTLEHQGAVSEQTVIEMVDGALHTLEVDVAVATTGVAGPDGGSPEKPIGTIWICAGNTDIKITYLLRAGKDRGKNIEIATVYALTMLRKFIKENY
ncbi:MAG: competence/damage-inducible protein A [Saprospiraceae bacterium]|nr:competence/damage-inducible protein A [Saprospiraceae bacterium]